ncbi:hypothetical protein [Chryseobacterium sp. HMWF035]|uniref:hypothetical protein n=1 Tax=Chryseobacterium sp. HMWF035 TaxID=2056868 RepID=UPI00140229CF|nr:hypothetical protein [Chryseobacterium sp. HMWF035]
MNNLTKEKTIRMMQHRTQRRIRQRLRQKAFKNEQISIVKLKKDYEKFTLPPNPR